MPDVKVKTPNLDEIFEKWKTSANRKHHKALEAQFGTKGSVFSLDIISAAEYVKNPVKGAAVYFSVKQTAKPGKGKDEIIVTGPRVSKETYYTFKGKNVDKDNWKGAERVPTLESIAAVQCKTCKGKGYTEDNCRSCKGKGKVEDELTVLEGEDMAKVKGKTFSYPCAICYGSGKDRIPCKECGGHQNLYKYEILPVPFKSAVIGVPILHSSVQTKYEKEIGKDLQDLIESVEGIRFNNFKALNEKAEGSLGYWNKDIKKTISGAGSDFKKYEKDKNSKITSQIYLFPMILLECMTKKNKKFEVYSIGSETNFMIYSNFA